MKFHFLFTLLQHSFGWPIKLNHNSFPGQAELNLSVTHNNILEAESVGSYSCGRVSLGDNTASFETLLCIIVARN